MRAVLCVLLVIAASPAEADRAAAKSAYGRAVKQYALGEYEAALEGFTAAYNELPEPALIFNLAQCQRQLGNKQKAVTLYKSYLRETHGTAPNADEVKRITSNLEQDLAREQATKQIPPTGVTPPVAAPAPVPEAPPPAVVAPPKPVVADTGMSTLRKAGIGVAVGGVVLAAVGIGLAASAPGVAGSADHAGSLASAHDEYNRAGNFNTAGWALIGVGAAAAVVGVVLCVLPHRQRVNALLTPMRAGALVAW